MCIISLMHPFGFLVGVCTVEGLIILQFWQRPIYLPPEACSSVWKLLVSSQSNLTVFCDPWAKYPDVEASILSNIDIIAVSLNKQMSCTLHLCNMLLYSAANWSFHLGGSFLSLMAKGQQIFGYELGGNLTHI